VENAIMINHYQMYSGMKQPMINRKKSNKKYYIKNRNSIKQKVKENCKQTSYKAQKKYQKNNPEYHQEYIQVRNQNWNKLPEDKKLEIMNQMCRELVND
jgi:predicted Fe-S protein YdhL (DUF1289 family)